MPRRKVDENHCRRCVRACDNCKRRKERYHGKQPCGRCCTRAVGATCQFSQYPVKCATTTRRNSQGLNDDVLEARELINELSEAPNSTEEPLYDVPDSPRRASGILIPQMSRLIRDTRGKFMFIGDSANLCHFYRISGGS